MRPSVRRSIVSAALVLAPMATTAANAAPGSETACPRPTPASIDLAGSAIDQARRAAEHGPAAARLWRENDPLPMTGDWLDAVATLGGLAQQDRLRSTLHDEEKCGAMVALAAAIVGGPERFARLLDRLDERARGRDREAIDLARRRFERRTLTAGDLHRVSEVLYRTYVGGRDGSTDGDISRMVRAAGFRSRKTAAKTPSELLGTLAPGELFPLNVYLEQPQFIGWHVVLVWKDRAGVVRLYDSDRDAGRQMFVRGTRPFRESYLEYVAPKAGIAAEWLPGTVFTPGR